MFSRSRIDEPPAGILSPDLGVKGDIQIESRQIEGRVEGDIIHKTIAIESGGTALPAGPDASGPVAKSGTA